MTTSRSFGFIDWLLVLVVLATAVGVRAWYVSEFMPPPAAEGQTPPTSSLRQVQDVPTDPVPGVAPGYAMARQYLERGIDEFAKDQVNKETALLWLQVALGGLTAALCYGLAWRAFASSPVALLAGLAYSFSPIALINVAEFQDGVLTSFLLMLALASGARAGQESGALSSFVFGIALAALVLVRLIYLPFAFVAILWFLLRSRTLRMGWLCALTAFLGFGGGVAPWIVKNYQDHQDPLPIVDTTWWHVWVGNNPKATGGPITGELKDVVGEERLQALQSDKADKDVRKHSLLTDDVLEEVYKHPFATVERRLNALVYFFTGKPSLGGSDGLVRNTPLADTETERSVLFQTLFRSDVIYYVLYGMLLLAFFGWRWSYGWRRSSMPLQIALVWIPLPYVLSHAELLHGPRLPLDGPLFILAALAVGCLIPGLRGRLLAGELQLPRPEEPTAPPA